MAETQPNSLAVTSTDSHANVGTVPIETKQFVTFTIGEEEYGVDILTVREIKGWSETTMLPNTPDYMRGVLNLRGLIVPIFDLRCRFGGGDTEVTSIHVVIIVAVGDRLLGILVDTVSDILSVNFDNVLPVPEMDTRVDNDFLSGLVTVDGRMVALLDATKLFNSRDIDQGQDAAMNA